VPPSPSRSRTEQRLAAGLALAQQAVLAAQMVVGPRVRIGQHLRCLVEPELELPVEQGPLQAPQVRVGVQG
jgi:hypothetical protein